MLPRMEIFSEHVVFSFADVLNPRINVDAIVISEHFEAAAAFYLQQLFVDAVLCTRSLAAKLENFAAVIGIGKWAGIRAQFVDHVFLVAGAHLDGAKVIEVCLDVCR